ncbi:MAG: DUF4910 domain-containing protein [Candidatus Latescibacteria bacterium]|nr:DUF4910 domain-containing protein [Candidatus Latescibacterota bacterium]
MLERIYEMLAGELSGENAKEMAARIHAFDRTCSYDNFSKSARYCLDRMREFGLQSPELLKFPADGKQTYGDYRMPRAWNVKKAELRVVEPGKAARRVASYRAEPLSLAMYSPPTPKGGVTADLISVEGGSKAADYEGVDCKGKIVLGSQSAAAVVKEAVKHGSVGVVTDFMPTFPHARPTPFDLPDAHVWSKVDADQGAFAFVLSPQEGRLLRDSLSREKRLVLRASVDSRSYDGNTCVVTGLIPGRRKGKEILLVAHLFEPGANDNASGPALCLELARSLTALIRKGDLRKPQCGIRLLFGAEFVGPMAYFHTHRDVATRSVVGFNLDMVGEDQGRCRSALTYQSTPDACPSFANSLMAHGFAFARDRYIRPIDGKQSEPFFHAYSAGYWGNDCFISDPTLGVPTVALINWPDRFYHTSADTPDKIDPGNMHWLGKTVGAMAYLVASARELEVCWLAEQVAAHARMSLSETASGTLTEIYDLIRGGRTDAETVRERLGRLQRRLRYLAETEIGALRSILPLLGRKRSGAAGRVKALEAAVGEAAAAVEEETRRAVAVVARESRLGKSAAFFLKPAPSPRRSAAERKAAAIVPRRTFAGLMQHLSLSEEQKKRMGEIGKKGVPRMFLFWVDGRRDLLTIARAMEQETGKAVDSAVLVEYCEFLAEHGYLKLQSRPR